MNVDDWFVIKPPGHVEVPGAEMISGVVCSLAALASLVRVPYTSRD